MIRILIVDDEKIVRDSLSWIIRQEYGEDARISTARSGLEGIDLACEFRPDILLMDIRMPGISGLDAAQEIRSVLPDSTILFISAHEDFHYVRKALQMGAADYVNKPVNRKEFLAALKQAVHNLETKRAEKQKTLKFRNEYFLTKPVLEQNLMYSILFSQGTIGPELLEFQDLRNSLAGGGWIVTARFIPDPRQYDGMEPGGTFFPDDLLLRIKARLKETLPCLMGPLILNSVSGLIPWSAEENSQEGPAWLREKSARFWEGLSEEDRERIQCGIGAYAETDRLHDSYNQSLFAITGRNTPGLSLYAERQPERDTDRTILPDFLSSTEETGEILLDQLLRTKGDFQRILAQLAEESAGMIGGLRRKASLLDSWFASGEYLHALFSRADAAGLKEWLRLFLSSYRNSMHDRSDQPAFLEQTVRIIDGNFQDSSLSLESVAAECSVNPAYLSARFREVMGINFMQYLTDKRLNLACGLLGQPSRSVKEICFAIGYRDPNYFSRLFRSRYGLSPSEFRRKGRERP